MCHCDIFVLLVKDSQNREPRRRRERNRHTLWFISVYQEKLERTLRKQTLVFRQSWALTSKKLPLDQVLTLKNWRLNDECYHKKENLVSTKIWWWLIWRKVSIHVYCFHIVLVSKGSFLSQANGMKMEHPASFCALFHCLRASQRSNGLH